MVDRSEGSVVLAFCVALGVATGGLGLYRLDVAKSEAAAAKKATSAPAAPAAPDPVARGKQGAVASAAPEASEAGLAMLRRGGNAVDALVAASFAVCVVRPQSTGIGGGGFAIYRDAAGQVLCVDGRERAPGRATPTMFLDREGQPTSASRIGHKAAGVPGLVAMLDRLHAKHGKLDWKVVLQPAIDLAEEGFVVPAGLTRAIEKNAALLRRDGAAAAIFMPGMEPVGVGARLVQKDLARTLREIAEHRSAGFYQGWVAERIADSQRSGGGLITQQDLRDYKVVEREPVRGRYRGHEVISMAPPSSGGVALIQMLQVLEPLELGKLQWQSPAHVHALAETMRRAFADRSKHMADPDHVTVPTAWLLSQARADEIRRGIDRARATPSSEVQPGEQGTREGGNTTHVSVIDADGNACSSTHTINLSFGSGVVVPGAGIVLNNEMDDFAAKAGEANAFGLVQGAANLPAAGKRPLSSMAPTIVTKDGKVVLVLGSPGGPTIITSVLQVLSNVIDFGKPLAEAVEAQRIHHQWDPDVLRIEDGLPRATVDELARMGHVVGVLVEERMGEVQAIQVAPNGDRVAVSDSRGVLGRSAAY